MNDNEKKNGDWKIIVGGIALIIVLFAGIRLIFFGLEQMIPKQAVDVSQSAPASQDVSAEQDAPSFCIHCGKGLPESFRWGQFCPWCGEKIEE